MAILQSLLVSGDSRLLNKLYVNEVDVGGNFKVNGTLTSEGVLYVGTSTAANAQIYLNNRLALDGSQTAWLRINTRTNDTSGGFTSGIYCGSSILRTDGNLQVGASGAKMNVNSSAATFAVPTTFTYVTPSGSTNYALKVNDKASIENATINVGNSTTGNINKVNAGNVDVKDTLRSFKWDIQHVAQLHNDFRISPTVEFSANATVQITAISGTTVTLNILDANTITSDTLGGARWLQNSQVKIVGKLGDVLLGVCNGTIKANMNTTTGRLDLQVTCANASQLQVKTYGTSEVHDLIAMLYTVGSTNPIGIHMTSYGENKASYIDIYGGSQTYPIARLGKLEELYDTHNITVNGEHPSGWGLYTSNGYFQGMIVSSAGKIGNFNLGDAIYYGTNSISSTTPGVYLGSDGVRNYKDDNTYVNISQGVITAKAVDLTGKITASSGAIGGFKIDSTSIRTNDVAVTSNADNSISLSSADFTRTINSTSRSGLRFAIGDKFGVTGDGIIYAGSAVISGAITATSLSTGTKTAATTGKGFFVNSTGDIYVGDGSTNNFTVTAAGAITAKSGTIGAGNSAWNIGTGSLYSGNATPGYNTSTLVFSTGTASTKSIGGSDTSSRTWMLSAGTGFGVTTTGALYCNDIHISGSGSIAGSLIASGIDAGNITAGNITTDRLKVNVISAINGNTGTTKIAAGKVEIDGTAVFNSIKSSTDAAYDAKGTAETINNKAISRGEQLVTNGNGMMGNNTNFTNWTFDGSMANSSPGSFTRTGGYANIASNDWFPVDASKRYRFEFDMISQNNTGTMYAYLLFGDVDKNAITATNTMWYPNTLTTLARDLKSGDTVVYLTSVANYNTYGSANHLRALIFWNYQNSFGYQYPSQTYSRITKMPAWTDNSSIDTTNNTITLTTAHSGATIPAGTYVSQGCSGGTYKYVAITGQKVPTTWTHYVGYFDGIDYSGWNADGKFPPGTAYCKVGFLWNYNSANDQFWVTNIQVYEDYKTDINTALAYPAIHTLNSGYSKPENYDAGNWTIASPSSTAGVKVGDTVRIKCTVSDMNNAIVYVLGTVTQIVSSTVLRMTSHGMDTTVIDGGMIWTGKVAANRIDVDSITIGQSQVTNLTTDLGNKASKTEAQGYATSAIDNLQIGGENLIPLSKNLKSFTVENASRATATFTDDNCTITNVDSGTYGIYYNIDVETGAEYTVSINCISTNNSSAGRLSIGNVTAGSSAAWNGIVNYMNLPVGLTRQTFTVPSGCVKIRVYVSATNLNTSLTVNKVKLEKGNKVTDWSPAPQDLDVHKYITDINSNNGITIKPINTAGNDYLELNSSAISFYKNNAETVKLENSAFRIGKLASDKRNVYVTDSAVQIRNYTTVLAEYGSAVTIGETGTGKFNTYIDGNGVYMRKATTKFAEFTGSAVKFYDGGGTADANVMAQYGSSSATIGKPGSSHTTIDSNGMQVYKGTTKVADFGTDITVGQYASGVYNVFIDADTGVQNKLYNTVLSQFDSTSVKFYDGSGTANVNITAQFSSSGTVIGKSNNSHLELDYHSLQLKDETYTYFYVSDLRDSNGLATITHYQVADGLNRWFTPAIKLYQGISTAVYETGDPFGGDSPDTGYTFQLIDDPDRPYYSVNPTPPAGSKVVINYKTQSENAKAFTFGKRLNNDMIGPYSTATGIDVLACGFGSHAEGNGTIAASYYTHAEGSHTKALGYHAHSEGSTTIASGSCSHAEGQDTTASGHYSHVEGSQSVASGSESHAEGYHTLASGYCAHTEGDYTTAGYQAHAEGYKSNAAEQASHAEGYESQSLGWASHAEGAGSIAMGYTSHAQNYHCVATEAAQTVIGKYNAATVTISGNDTTYSNAGDYAFIIGNGSDDTTQDRSNALTVDWSGNVNIASGAKYKINGTALSASDVSAVPTSDVSTSGGASKVIKTDSSGNINLASGAKYKVNGTSLLELVYPIGAIYISTASTSPATLFGFGTWVAIEGQFLLGATTSTTPTNTDASQAAGQTGGAATVTLTAAQSGLRAHSHAGSSDSSFLTTTGDAITRHTVASGSGAANMVRSPGAIERKSNTASVDAANASAAHNNMPPFLSVYIWKRTA